MQTYGTCYLQSKRCCTFFSMYVVLHPIMNGSRNQADLLCTRRCQFAHCLSSHCFNTLHWSEIISVESSEGKSVTSVRRPKMKRDAGVKCCLFTIKRQHFTPASLFIFGRRTDVTVLMSRKTRLKYANQCCDKKK